MIELNLPFPVSVNALFFNRKGGRAPTKEYAAWRRQAGWEIVIQKPEPISGPVGLMYTFEEGRRADLGNLEKCCTDLLVKHGLIEDDGPAIVKQIILSFSKQQKGAKLKVFEFK